jgi:RNA polymerase sigma factor (sigma-70 family)
MSQPRATTTLSTIRTTNDRTDDASPAVRDAVSPAVRDAMLAAVPHLRAFAMSLGGKVDLADDLVQETLLRAIAYINSFRPGTNMSAWLFTILRSLFRSEYRKRRSDIHRLARLANPSRWNAICPNSLHEKTRVHRTAWQRNSVAARGARAAACSHSKNWSAESVRRERFPKRRPI